MKRFATPFILATAALIAGAGTTAQGSGGGPGGGTQGGSSGGQQQAQQQGQQQAQQQAQQQMQQQMQQQQQQQMQQQQQQQQQMQQQQMQQQETGAGMQQRFGETEQLRERFRAMEQRAGAMEGELARERGQLSPRQRQRDQAIEPLCQSMRQSARQMQSNLDGLESAMRDPALAGDPEALRHMDRLREQLRIMADGLDESLRLMEQVRNRSRQGE